MELHDPLHNGQSQPGAAAVPRLVRPVKAVEDPRQICFPDPNAVILDRQEGVSILFLRPDSDRAACLSLLDPILHQVQQQLGHQALVGGKPDLRRHLPG